MIATRKVTQAHYFSDSMSWEEFEKHCDECKLGCKMEWRMPSALLLAIFNNIVIPELTTFIHNRVANTGVPPSLTELKVETERIMAARDFEIQAEGQKFLEQH